MSWHALAGDSIDIKLKTVLCERAIVEDTGDGKAASASARKEKKVHYTLWKLLVNRVKTCHLPETHVQLSRDEAEVTENDLGPLPL